MNRRLGIVAGLLLSAVQVAAQGDLVISELLYQPLTGEAEYVELYNRGSSACNLHDYHVVRWIGDSLGRHYALPDHEVAAHDYVVVTKDAASVAACFEVRYASKLVECQLPPYPNDGGSVVLATADSVVVDRFDYSPAMHSPLLRKQNGVSLERRSYGVATNVASNWFSAASTAGFGTPGYGNSQSEEWLALESAFEFSSAIVSPDGDGYCDELTIEYSLAENGLAATGTVYDEKGRRVRRLLDNDLLGSHGAIVWDGKGEGGQRLAVGHYVVSLTLFDTSGSRQTVKRAVAVVYR